MNDREAVMRVFAPFQQHLCAVEPYLDSPAPKRIEIV
jgi:hypothetical protein